jgi:hypothetical protein
MMKFPHFGGWRIHVDGANPRIVSSPPACIDVVHGGIQAAVRNHGGDGTELGLKQLTVTR